MMPVSQTKASDDTPPNSITLTTISNSVTVKINSDLFHHGIMLNTRKYGNYFANLESSSELDLKFKTDLSNKFNFPQKSESEVTGGLRLGGYVAESSRLYLKVGFHSENFGQPSTLKTRNLTAFNGGFYKTALASGVGFEYGVNNKITILGECSTRTRDLPMLEQKHKKPKTENIKARDNRILIGFKYLFGNKK
jgi:hypothetical protein